MLPLLGAFPFIAGAWIGLSFWPGREPRIDEIIALYARNQVS